MRSGLRPPDITPGRDRADIYTDFFQQFGVPGEDDDSNRTPRRKLRKDGGKLLSRFKQLARLLKPQGVLINLVSSPEIYWHEWAIVLDSRLRPEQSQSQLRRHGADRHN